MSVRATSTAPPVTRPHASGINPRHALASSNRAKIYAYTGHKDLAAADEQNLKEPGRN